MHLREAPSDAPATFKILRAGGTDKSLNHLPLRQRGSCSRREPPVRTAALNIRLLAPEGAAAGACHLGDPGAADWRGAGDASLAEGLPCSGSCGDCRGAPELTAGAPVLMGE